jgi:arabinogalactan oligomer/maltooligosaccharide transport system substrate-binding protein
MTMPILGLVLALAAVGCGGDDNDTGSQAAGSNKDKPATLTYWSTHNEGETPTMQKIVDSCQQKLPNIKVNMQTQVFDGAQNKFRTAAQAGSAPDIMRSEVAWVADFAAQGFLLPLDKYVSEADKADYLTQALAYDQFGGKLWGVPQVTDALALMYNKRLLEEKGITAPPATLDELKADVEKFDKDPYGFYMRADPYWLQPFIWGYGGGLVDTEAKKVLINDAKSVAGAQYVLDLVNGKGVAPNRDFTKDYDNAMTAFKSGKAAMILNGPWSTADVLSGKEFKDKANLGVAPIPPGPGGQGSPVGGHNYTIFAGTKAPDQAYAFVECMNSTENQALFATENNLLPTRKSAYEDASVKSNALLGDFQKVMEKATARPVAPEAGSLYTEFGPAWQKAYSDKASAQEALDEVAAAWKTLFNY